MRALFLFVVAEIVWGQQQVEDSIVQQQDPYPATLPPLEPDLGGVLPSIPYVGESSLEPNLSEDSSVRFSSPGDLGATANPVYNKSLLNDMSSKRYIYQFGNVHKPTEALMKRLTRSDSAVPPVGELKARQMVVCNPFDRQRCAQANFLVDSGHVTVSVPDVLAKALDLKSTGDACETYTQLSLRRNWMTVLSVADLQRPRQFVNIAVCVHPQAIAVLGLEYFRVAGCDFGLPSGVAAVQLR